MEEREEIVSRSPEDLKEDLLDRRMDYLERALTDLKRRLEAYRNLSVLSLSISLLSLIALLVILALALTNASISDIASIQLPPWELELVFVGALTLPFALYSAGRELVKDLVWLAVLGVSIWLLKEMSPSIKVGIAVVSLLLSIATRDEDASTGLLMLSIGGALASGGKIGDVLITISFLISSVLTKYKHRWFFPAALLSSSGSPWLLLGLPVALLRAQWTGKFLSIFTLSYWASVTGFKEWNLSLLIGITLNTLVSIYFVSAWYEAGLGSTAEVEGEEDELSAERAWVPPEWMRRLFLYSAIWASYLALKSIYLSALTSIDGSIFKGILLWLPSVSLILTMSSFGFLGLVIAATFMLSCYTGELMLPYKLLSAVMVVAPRSFLGVSAAVTLLLITIARWGESLWLHRTLYTLTSALTLLHKVELKRVKEPKPREKLGLRG